jgi:hypothetical protein
MPSWGFHQPNLYAIQVKTNDNLAGMRRERGVTLMLCSSGAANCKTINSRRRLYQNSKMLLWSLRLLLAAVSDYVSIVKR